MKKWVLGQVLPALEGPSPEPVRARRKRIILLTGWVLLVTGIHFSLGTGTHREHVLHLIFAGLYLLPIVLSALWWGFRGGLSASAAISGIYFVHMRTTWAGQPMENVNQVATMGIFLFLGIAAGRLADLQEEERRLRLAGEARAQRQAIIQGLASLGNALRHRDESTREHCERVSHMAVEIGRRRALTPEALEILRLSALVHDVGKIGVRDDILLKPEELTPEERALIERHPVIAAEILRPLQGTGDIAEIVLSHHECPDGSGYPRGLSGEQITIEARILRVADVFDALLEARRYKPAMALESVLAHMDELAGTKLDLESVQALRALCAEGIWMGLADP